MQQVTNTFSSKNIYSNAQVAKGAIFVIIGIAILLRHTPGLSFLMPNWLYGFHSFLILVGIYSGIKHSFRNYTWLVLILLGVFLGIDDLNIVARQTLSIFALPIGLIILGIYTMFKRK